MREIKIRYSNGWIELPYDLPMIELYRVLDKTRLRLVWNIPARRLEVMAIH